ncbi:MAG: TRAP transporter large permease subunit, partial [Eubacteriales bacterium]
MDPLLAMIVLVGLFVLLLISGMPIAFSLLLSSSISLYISFGLPGLFSVYTALFSAVRNELYVAIPMFTLMAMLLMRSGVGEQIY